MAIDAEQIKQLAAQALGAVGATRTKAELEQVRIKYLGRKGGLTALIKSVKDLPTKERGKLGKELNAAKQQVEKALAEQKSELAKSQSQGTWIDTSLPGRKPELGHLHIITQAIFEIEDILAHLGFIRRRYPEVDTEQHVFDDLGMPPDHPARDDFESFFLTNGLVLTTHTSNGQIHEMLRGELPIRMTNIGRCYRPESDINHYYVFHQFEGLVIDKDVSIADLKGTLTYFTKSFFGPERETRLRPHDFRFTEPSFEVDVTCGLCGGTGCKFCKEGWVELGGAGMVHPDVIRAGGLDPEKVNGFAFGWGVERVALMRGLNIPDIRMLWENDLRFLQQF